MAVQYERETTATTALSTELDSLADNAGAVSGSYFAGGSYTHGEAELYVSSPLTASIGDAIARLYLIREIDGTNYEDYTTGASGGAQYSALVGTFGAGSSSAQRMIIRGFDIPPGDYKAFLLNVSGQSFPASGNTVKIRGYRAKDV